MADLPENFDLEALLAPISDDAPTGTDMREDTSPTSPYYMLRDARADARAAERAAEAPDAQNAAGGSATPLWQNVRNLATGALTKNSKDLEVAAWLAEALLRIDGLPGATAGFLMLGGLVEKYWDDLFPGLDEDGIEGKVRPIGGLNGISGDGTLIQPLRQVMLFQRPDGTPVELWQYEQSVQVAGIGEAAVRQARIAAGAIPFETLQTEARADPHADFVRLRRRAAEADAAWQALGAALDARAGADAPPTARVHEVLQEFLEVARVVGRVTEEEPIEAEAAAQEAPAGAAEPAPGGAAIPVAGAVASREDALRALNAIAEYFRRSEPHSPLSYTLQEAVRRARMSWPQLLEELVPDEAARSTILTTLGIRPPAG